MLDSISPANYETYLSVKDLAGRLNVSKDTIWRWKREGNFPKAVKLSAGVTRWRLSDIEDWEGQRTTCFSTQLI